MWKSMQKEQVPDVVGKGIFSWHAEKPHIRIHSDRDDMHKARPNPDIKGEIDMKFSP